VVGEEHDVEAAGENSGRGGETEDVVGDAVFAVDGGEDGEVVVAGDDGHSMDHLKVVTACASAQQDQTAPACGLVPCHHNVTQMAGEGHDDAEVDVINDGEEEEEGRFLGPRVASPFPASRACLPALPHPVKNAYVANPFTAETAAARTRWETVDFASR